MQIFTTKGLIDSDELEIVDIVKWSENAREVATEYRHQGELVKRSVHIDICRPIGMDVQLGRVA